MLPRPLLTAPPACGDARERVTPRRHRRVGRLALPGVMTWALVACGGSGNADDAGAPPVLGGPVLGAPPPAVSCGASNLGAATAHLYVRTDGADGPSCGSTPASACATLDQALARCAADGPAGCVVLARWGRYTLPDTLALRAGVHLYGSCRFDNEPDRRFRSTLVGPAGQPAVRATGLGSAPVAFENFQVLAGAGRAPGGASVALQVTDSRALSLANVQLVAGPGADGGDGAAAALPANGAAGGLSGNRAAGSGCTPAVDGGAGGSGNICTHYAAGVGGASWGMAGGAAGTAGDNGLFCPDRAHDWVGNGGAGGTGRTGGCAAQAKASPSTAGTLSGDGTWLGVAGGDGVQGQAGSGGGGGGHGGYCGDQYYQYQGGVGGGGGGGGCGGLAGRGGGQGGASIALVMVRSTVNVGMSSLVATNGGHGGRGGDGSPGASGGPGGPGQAVGTTLFWAHDCPGSGAAGGAGGAGGGGSAGAAGNGGPSIAYAHREGSSVVGRFAAQYGGQPGQPGPNGRGAPPGWWTPIANEKESFSLAAAGWVRYGAGSGWTLRWVSGSGTCSNEAFGGDPAPNVPKSCAVAAPWLTVASEGDTVVLDWPTTVRYGAGDRWATRQVSQSIACSSTAFGSDPAYGVHKHCEIQACAGAAAAQALPGTVSADVDFDNAAAAAASNRSTP